MRLLWIICLSLIADQVIKVTVRIGMFPGESIAVAGNWLRITFAENPGMAFGLTMGPRWLIPVMALVATTLIGGYLYHVRRGYAPYTASLAFVMGGALGNLVDRIFYGVWFEYGPLFQGRVVDYLHINVWRGYVPPEVPFWGGTYATLLPIFNLADVFILGGVIGLLVYQGRYHQQLAAAKQDGEPEDTTSPFAAPAIEAE
ncbi:MAG: signal peptidase II [Bacteroidota bacterium]